MKKVATILLSLGVGVLLIMIGAAVLLPSTKRGSIDMEEFRRRRAEAEAAATTRAATLPATQAKEAAETDLPAE